MRQHNIHGYIHRTA